MVTKRKSKSAETLPESVLAPAAIEKKTPVAKPVVAKAAKVKAAAVKPAKVKAAAVKAAKVKPAVVKAAVVKPAKVKPAVAAKSKSKPASKEPVEALIEEPIEETIQVPVEEIEAVAAVDPAEAFLDEDDEDLDESDQDFEEDDDEDDEESDEDSDDEDEDEEDEDSDDEDDSDEEDEESDDEDDSDEEVDEDDKAETADGKPEWAGDDSERKLERLQKILAQAGIASRRRAEELIEEGHVQVNGQVVTTLGTKADALRDHIRVDGKLLHGAERHRYFQLNKPKGFVTTVTDPEGRPTVMSFFGKMKERLYPVGRLDYLSEGLLLVTNDGELANQLTRAASGVEKAYLVKISRQPSEEAIEQLRQGVMIQRGRAGEGMVRTAPSRIRQVRKGDNPWFEVVLTEGRNRELRKMFEEIGHFVEKIRRVGYGPLVLDVEPGMMRELTLEEVQELRDVAAGKRRPVSHQERRLRKEIEAEMLPTVRPASPHPSMGADRGRPSNFSDRRPAYGARGGDRPNNFRPKPYGDQRPTRSFDGGAAPRRFEGAPAEGGFRPREGGEGRPNNFAPRGGDRPNNFRPKPYGDQRPARSFDGGAPKRFEGGQGGSFRPREGSEGRPARPYDSNRPSGPSRGFAGKSFGSDRPARPYDSNRPSGPSRGFAGKSFGSDRPAPKRFDGTPGGNFRPREGSEGRPARPYDSNRPSRPYESNRPSSPAGGFAGKSFGSDRPAPKRFDGAPGGSFRPREGSEGRPPRPYDGGRPSGPSRGFGGKPFGAGRPAPNRFESGDRPSGDSFPRPRPDAAAGGERPSFRPKPSFGAGDRSKPIFDRNDRPKGNFDRPASPSRSQNDPYTSDRPKPVRFDISPDNTPVQERAPRFDRKPMGNRPSGAGYRPRPGGGSGFKPRSGFGGGPRKRD